MKILITLLILEIILGCIAIYLSVGFFKEYFRMDSDIKFREVERKLNKLVSKK